MVFDGKEAKLYSNINTMNDLCIVTARGGSKRVPRKNVRPLCGQPLVFWPVSAAVASHLFHDVLISTDDDAIAAAAEKAGAIFPFRRRPELADDHAATCDVLRADLEQWREYRGELPEYCCCLYGTSAFVTPEQLREARKLVATAECVMAVSEYPHPIQRAVTLDAESNVAYVQPEYVGRRTQDCPPRYHDLGLFYYFSVAAFLAHGGRSFLPLRIKALVTPRTSAVDIDTEDDWALAEALAVRNGLTC